MTEREDPIFWRKQCMAYSTHAQPVLDQYVRYCRWFRGEMGDLERRLANQLPRGTKKTMVSLTNLVVVTARAELFFRAPRFHVRPPGTLNSSLFTPELAHVETLGLNHTVQEVGLYRQGRKALLDGLLGPFMVMKVGYSADVGIDDELVEEQRSVADQENQKFVGAGIRMKMKEDDVDAVHIEQHEQVLSLAQRGALQLPKKEMKYLEKHVQMHRDRMEKGGGRGTETIRKDSVFVKRISPLNFFMDPWHDDLDDREWTGYRYIMRIEDVKANNDYSKKARDGITAVSQKWLADSGLPPLPSESLMTPDQYTLCYEIVDHVKKQVLILGHGASVPLLIKPYKLANIMPSGPYVVRSFMEDPLEDYGIPPPAIYEAHQLAASFIASVNTTAVKRSLPKVLYDPSKISPQEIEELKRGQVAGLIPVKNLGPNQKIKDIFEQTPVAQIPEQNLAIGAYHERKAEQLSGLGSAKLAGGDQSKTATASAIIGEATTTLAEDRASVVDDMLQEVGRKLVRLKRCFYTSYRMAEEVGEEAIEHWPREWATRDIVNDRGVGLVSGSSRRNNAAVEQKMLEEAYTLVSQDPMFQMIPSAIGMKFEILERLMESLGQYGFDYAGVKRDVLAAIGAGQAGPGASEGAGGPSGQNPDENAPAAPGEPVRANLYQARTQANTNAGGGTRSDQIGGVNNVGGGRVPTGASKGDKPRLMRGSPSNRKAVGR